MEGKPLVTFITVVYNGVSELEPTIQSILSQTDKRFEYFILDGGSTDGTIDLIKKYESRISGWVSQKDNGLYDAMNNGMKMGHGSYLWFMNAGDRVYSGETLSKIFASVELKGTRDEGRETTAPRPSSLVPVFPDVIYGETEIIDKDGNPVGDRRLKAPKKLTWKNLQWGMVVCHQSFLVKRELCTPYDLQYKFAADIDWMIRTLKQSNSIHNAGFILSQFKSGGLSQKNIRNSLKERFRMMVQYYGFFTTVFNHVVLGTKLFFYYLRYRRI